VLINRLSFGKMSYLISDPCITPGGFTGTNTGKIRWFDHPLSRSREQTDRLEGSIRKRHWLY
jgi:hypothetical protein